MKILTKCSLEEGQASDRVRKGASDFEIYTNAIDVENIYEEIESKLNLIKKLNMNIHVVHAPVICGYDVEDLIINFADINKVFFLANEIGKLQNRTILVVLHMDYNLIVLERLRVLREIIEKLKVLESAYENTNIVIENLMIIQLDNNEINIRQNYKEEASKFAEFFNEKTNSNIGSVLDICHMLASIELLKNFRGMITEKHIPSIDDYINDYIKTLKIVHLSYSKNLGIGKDNHGILYKGNPEDMNVLFKIIKSLNDVGYDGIITLEVSEDNYLDSKNWIITRDNLYKVFDDLNIKYYESSKKKG